jgi:Tol biopolymer transport system component
VKKYRWTLLFGGLLLLWLAFGPQLLQRLITPQLSVIEGMPSGVQLQGSLFYTQAFEGIKRVDLSNGAVSSWWQPPEGGLVTGLTASPDGAMLVVSYAPPAEEGYQTGTTDLYLTAASQPDLQPLRMRESREESFRDPAWSSDGQWLYYTHLKPTTGSSGIQLNVERLPLDDQDTSEVVLQGAEQAVLSPDNAHIAYLKFDPRTYARDLVLANFDGSNAQTLIASGIFAALSGPLFTLDSRSVIFSASGELPSAQAGIVRAHGRPWNIWKATPDEDALTRVTPTTLDGPAVAWLPDGQNMAVIAAEGVFVVYNNQFYRLAQVTTEGEIAWAK